MIKKYLIIFLIVFSSWNIFHVGSLIAQGSPQSITSLESSINTLQSQITTYNSQIQSLSTQKSNYSNSLASENAIFVNEQNNLNAIQNLLNNLSTRLNNDKSKEIIDLKNRNLDYKILYEDTKVNPFYVFFTSGSMHSFLDTWGSVQSQAYNLKNEISTINTKINNINNGLAFENKQKVQVQGEIATVNAKKNSLYNQIYGISGSINNVSSLISNVNAKIANLEAEKAQIISEEKHATSESSVAQTTVQNNVNTINNNIGTNIPSITNKCKQTSCGTYSISVNGKTFTNVSGPLNIDSQNTSSYSTVNGVKYLGSIELRTDTNVPFINIVPLRYYLEGLGEMPSSWTPTALSSQAIAARSYTLYHMGQFASYHYDLSSSPNVDQNYIGYSKNEDCTVNGYCNWLQAVANTSGQVEESNGNILDAFYNAMNGNITVNSNQMAILINDTNYLQNGSGSLSSRESTIQNCSYWCILPNTIVSSSNLSSITTDYSGSLNNTIVVNGNITLSAQYFAYVYNVITPVGYFVRVPNYNASPQNYGAYFSLTGNSSAGFTVDSLYGGLWVGLSQYGAENMSLSGFSLNQILQDYYGGYTITNYPNTTLVNVRVGIAGSTTTSYSITPTSGFNIYANGSLIYSSSSAQTINITQ